MIVVTENPVLVYLKRKQVGNGWNFHRQTDMIIPKKKSKESSDYQIPVVLSKEDMFGLDSVF
eukprot:UN20246